MKFKTGQGLYVYVPAQHVVSIYNYRTSRISPEKPMSNTAQVQLTTCENIVVEGKADVLYQQVIDELHSAIL